MLTKLSKPIYLGKDNVDFLFRKATSFKQIVHGNNSLRHIIPATKNNRHGH